MRWLNAEQVAALNARFVGPGALRDAAALESAVARPWHSAFGQDAYPSVHDKAAALLHALARNHPFVDGNKRTALYAVTVFYRRNGLVLTEAADETVTLTEAAARGALDVEEIAPRLAALTVPDPDAPG